MPAGAGALQLTMRTESFGVGGLTYTSLPVSGLHCPPSLVPQLLSHAFLLVRQLEVGLVGCVPVQRGDLGRHVTPATQAHTQT